MKRARIQMGRVLCALVLAVWLAVPAFAQSNEPDFYDCVLTLYAYDETEQFVSSSSGIQIQAGDGSGGFWAVGSYGLTAGTAYYVAVNPYDGDFYAMAEPIAGDEASGIAVFRLSGQVPDVTAPALRTLDGLSSGDYAVIAGTMREDDSYYSFYRSAMMTELETRNGYTCLTLQDGKYPLSELDIVPIGAAMSAVDEVIGFYVGDYQVFPAGYLMTGTDGIGTFGNGGSEDTPDTPTSTPDNPEPDTPSTPPEEEPGNGGASLEIVQADTGMEELLRRAQAERSRANLLRVVLIVAAVAAAAGLVAFALVRSRRQRAAAVPGAEPIQTDSGQTMGKTKYVGAQEYGKTEPAISRCRVIPLAGTPGGPREVPLQGLTFGRSPECDVTFAPDTGGVSGRHCALGWQNGALVLTDLHSSFGTLLEDGRKLTDESIQVTNGMRFYLGSRQIGFQIELQ